MPLKPHGYLDIDGYSWESIQTDNIIHFREACQEILDSTDKSFGVRGALRRSEELTRLSNEYLVPIAKRHLGSNAFIVRSILFDKPLDANWAVPWHQDVTIEVESKQDVPGFGPWSTKDGMDSVQPPAEVLEKMLTLRLHLDDTDGTNGALIVDPSSHLEGKKHINDIQAKNPVVLSCRSGAVLLMKPLLYHASNRSTSGKPRRILHLDFAANPLPEPLVWKKF